MDPTFAMINYVGNNASAMTSVPSDAAAPSDLKGTFADLWAKLQPQSHGIDLTQDPPCVQISASVGDRIVTCEMENPTKEQADENVPGVFRKHMSTADRLLQEMLRNSKKSDQELCQSLGFKAIVLPIDPTQAVEPATVVADPSLDVTFGDKVRQFFWSLRHPNTPTVYGIWTDEHVPPVVHAVGMVGDRRIVCEPKTEGQTPSINMAAQEQLLKRAAIKLLAEMKKNPKLSDDVLCEKVSLKPPLSRQRGSP